MKSILKRFLKTILGWAGFRTLTQQQTVDFLRPYQLASFPLHRQPLPEVTDAADASKILFRPNEAVTYESFVWQYPANSVKTSLLRSGNLHTNGVVLCTDFNTQDAVKDLVRPKPRRQVHHADTLIAPFGHYQDGFAFVGYYDFMMLVAAKLSLIKQAVPDVDFAEATISYPLFGTTYEQEFLAHLGFKPDRILDSRQHEVKFKQCLLSNNGDWSYPNAANLMALRQQLLRLVDSPDTQHNERMYISRAGRRRVLNEDELIAMLTRYDFKIIEDKPRTLAEQATLYNRASFIMGPHGASFANLVCCQPKTHLFELFAPGYIPNFFLYLAELMGMTYSGYVPGPITYSPARITAENQAEDITVSVSDIERKLNQYFT
jgi:capsular polysaccharide biosynthesis protein